MKKKAKVIESQTISLYEVANLELHPLAKTTPLMNMNNYEALKLDIVDKGQKEPITLYRGRIVDGRHRHKILGELGVNEIKAVSLPNNTTSEELKEIVFSKEIRRHETPAQLAISAYKTMQGSNGELSASKAAKMHGADRRKVSNVVKIAEFGRLDIIEDLFNGLKINIGTERSKNYTDSLPTILDWLKAAREDNKREEIPEEIRLTEAQFADCLTRVDELISLDIRQLKYIHNKVSGYIYDRENEIADHLNMVKEAAEE